jgi:hypothetical protein
MIELAEQQKELLSKYGMVEEVLQNARQSIDQLDQVVERGAQGRRIHIGASASLEVAANQVVRLVRILDGFNRFRLGGDPNLLTAGSRRPTSSDRRLRAVQRSVGRAVRTAHLVPHPRAARSSRPHDEEGEPARAP